MAALNYFNYFTEIEEYFWRKRGAHLLVSPLDWAIIETWQKAGIPVAAVLKGIDRAFESFQRSRRSAAGRTLKSLAYCVDAVLEAAEESKEVAAGEGPEKSDRSLSSAAKETFSRDAVRAFISRNAAQLATAAEASRAARPELSGRVEEVRQKLIEVNALLAAPGAVDLEDLDRRLTVLEEKLTASAMSLADEETLLTIRREMDRQLAPYRRKMSAEQLAQVERQYTQKRLLESLRLPRLSLFYLS